MTINSLPAVNVEKLYEDNENLMLSFYYLKILSEMKINLFPPFPQTPFYRVWNFFTGLF